MTSAPSTYLRRLRTFDATMVVVGGIIGAGIFLSPAAVAERVRTAPMVLATWVIGGAIAFTGALCFAELGARRPQAGGGYVYLREAFGPLAAFLYGWTFLLVINTGGMAAVAVTFARYAADVAGLAPGVVTPLAVGAVVLLTGVNFLGIRAGSVTQNVFTVLKLLALAVVIAAGVFLAVPGAVSGAGAASEAARATPSPGVLALPVALVPALFSYGGWAHANNVAGEVAEPERTLPRAMLAGMTIVVLVYVLANVAYLRALGADGLAASAAPASDTMRVTVGAMGARLIAAGIAASAFGFVNLTILSGARMLQAMAADGVFFAAAARLHPRYHTPAGALIAQMVWAVALTLTGSYGQLLDYVVFGDWVFFALIAATLFWYRRRDAASNGRVDGGAGSYRVPGYPVTPAVFVTVAAIVVLGAVASNARNSLIGAAILALGVPVFFAWRRGAERQGVR